MAKYKEETNDQPIMENCDDKLRLFKHFAGNNRELRARIESFCEMIAENFFQVVSSTSAKFARKYISLSGIWLSSCRRLF